MAIARRRTSATPLLLLLCAIALAAMPWCWSGQDAHRLTLDEAERVARDGGDPCAAVEREARRALDLLRAVAMREGAAGEHARAVLAGLRADPR